MFIHVCVCQQCNGKVQRLRPDDGLNKLTELRQKLSADRTAGWMVLAAGQSNVLLSYTHAHTHTHGVKGSVQAKFSSAPGYKAALIAALAKFQLVQA